MNQDSAYQANGKVIGQTGRNTWAVAISARSTEYLFTGTQKECEKFVGLAPKVSQKFSYGRWQ